jgi:hypothetical protein
LFAAIVVAVQLWPVSNLSLVSHPNHEVKHDVETRFKS